MKTKPKKFTCIAKKWFDKVNGNTYHSVRVIRHKDGAVVVGQFQYGYGDHYQQTAIEAMLNAGWLPKKYKKAQYRGDQSSSEKWSDIWNYERENNYPILWTVSKGLKRDCIANGTL